MAFKVAKTRPTRDFADAMAPLQRPFRVATDCSGMETPWPGRMSRVGHSQRHKIRELKIISRCFECSSMDSTNGQIPRIMALNRLQVGGTQVLRGAPWGSYWFLFRYHQRVCRLVFSGSFVAGSASKKYPCSLAFGLALTTV